MSGAEGIGIGDGGRGCQRRESGGFQEGGVPDTPQVKMKINTVGLTHDYDQPESFNESATEGVTGHAGQF